MERLVAARDMEAVKERCRIIRLPFLIAFVSSLVLCEGLGPSFASDMPGRIKNGQMKVYLYFNILQLSITPSPCYKPRQYIY